MTVMLLVSCSREEAPPGAEDLPQFPAGRKSARTPEGVSGDSIQAMNSAILNPAYTSAAEASRHLRDDDEVLLFRSRGTVYAYPLAVLSMHHVVNDTIAGEPVAITHCNLTDSAVVYSRRVDGRTFTFDPLTSFYYGNMAMFDAETSSYWTQLSGECVTGPLKGRRLEPVGSLERTRWSKAKRLADIKALALPGDLGPYRAHDEDMRSNRLGLEVLNRIQAADGRLPAYTLGLGIEVRGQSRFYPLETIAKKGLLNDELSGWRLLIVHDQRFDSSKILRGYCEGRRLAFEKRGEGWVDRETGSTWNLDGEATGGELRGRALPRPSFTTVYWYAWAAFYPETSCFQAGN